MIRENLKYIVKNLAVHSRVKENEKEKKKTRDHSETEDRQSKKMTLCFYISFYGSECGMFHAREN